ncbi:histidinol dehydrogenase [Adhaeribacter pallidiroseus]|uniref:Histidinol dehydrogenase n=1 Tax=Adhaeribacter pallidiroseus TaxID=2072847 RepID=A0A369QII0_9BACT|nr:histidinol dehydrogenase [Adhaeribacter pallidiroseus]RDC63077.1 Histidinol dehydrogenase [Adhaeribacter pallidiroseus]
MLKKVKYPDRGSWPNLVKRPVQDYETLEAQIKSVFEQVRLTGDEALLQFTAQFDKVELTKLLVTPEEFNAASSLIAENLKKAIQQAYQNIKTFHEAQQEEFTPVETMPGVTCWRKSVAIEKVGLYIPGGTAPLFSTLLMLGVPAKLAGCQQIVLCTPPAKDGSVHPAILFTASLLGIDTIVKVGGSQAIAALTFGTSTVPAVSKIFGPGNQYVTVAKQMAGKYGVAIDMPAGPSEVLVMADETTDPTFVAADLLSQAEHGTDSQVVLLTTSEQTLQAVEQALEDQAAYLSRQTIVTKTLNNSLGIILSSTAEMLEFSNLYAPEHLILSVKNYEQVAVGVINAGSVFLGPYSPESVGDYASGTNHTLPTNGYARAYSGVSLDSFVKKITFQHLTSQGLQQIGPHVEVLAAAEGLDAHQQAVSIRLKSLAHV